MTFISGTGQGVPSHTNTTNGDTNLGGVTTLSGVLTIDGDSVVVADAVALPEAGTVRIDNEYITYTGKSVGNANTLIGLTRGAHGSTAVEHDSGAIVKATVIMLAEYNNFPDVMLSVMSYGVGTLFMDFSVNNTEWNTFPVSGFNVEPGIHEFHTAVKGPRWYRCRLQAEQGTATTFRINTWYGVFRQGNLPLNQNIGDDNDSVVVRSVGVGQEPSGIYSNTKQNGVAYQATAFLAGTTLTEEVKNTDVTIGVTSTANFPPGSVSSPGLLVIGDEEITYTGTDPNVAFTGCTRGVNGTTAVVHAAGTPVGQVAASSVMDIRGFTQIQSQMKSSHAGTLVVRWSVDPQGVDVVRSIHIEYQEINTLQLYSAPVFAPYVSVQYYHKGGEIQTASFVGTSFLTQPLHPQMLGVEAYLPPSVVSTVQRSVITGKKPNEEYKNVNLDAMGHLEVALHDPILPFGSVHCESIYPLVQLDPVYGINDIMVRTATTTSGAVTGTNSLYVASTGISTDGAATLQSRDRLRYRPGQGSIARFSFMLTTTGDRSGVYQIGGLGHPEDGYYVSAVNGALGMLHVNRAYRQIVSLRITVSAIGDANVTLNGVTTVVPITSTNIHRTVYELTQATYPGWQADGIGDRVYFVAGSSGDKTGGTYTISSVTGTFSTTDGENGARTGAAGITTFIPQTEFNGDVLDGTKSARNPSGVLLDPSKLNIWEISMQYLGAGNVTLRLYTNASLNNGAWTTVHTVANPNTRTESHIGNPSLPFTMSAYKLGSTSTDDIQVAAASIQLGIEGKPFRHGPLISYRGNAGGIGGSIVPLFIVQNSFRYKGIPNQSVIHLRSLNAAASSSNNALTTIWVIRKPIIIGNPIFTIYDNNSCALFSDTAGLTVTPPTSGNQSMLMYSTTICEAGQTTVSFDSLNEVFDIQPGDTIAVCASSTATATVACSLNTREDQ